MEKPQTDNNRQQQQGKATQRPQSPSPPPPLLLPTPYILFFNLSMQTDEQALNTKTSHAETTPSRVKSKRKRPATATVRREEGEEGVPNFKFARKHCTTRCTAFSPPHPPHPLSLFIGQVATEEETTHELSHTSAAPSQDAKRDGKVASFSEAEEVIALSLAVVCSSTRQQNAHVHTPPPKDDRRAPVQRVQRAQRAQPNGPVPGQPGKPMSNVFGYRCVVPMRYLWRESHTHIHIPACPRPGDRRAST